MEAIEYVNPFNDRGKLENVINSPIVAIRVKLNEGRKLTREEKNKITKDVHDSSYFKTAVALLGMRISFVDVLHTYIVKQHGGWQEYKAVDKTSLRAVLYGSIDKIVEVKE